MVELYLVVSTFCYSTIWLINPDKLVDKCIQQVSISTTQPTPKEGETVYRVVKVGKEKTIQEILDDLEKETNRIRREYEYEKNRILEEGQPHLHKWKQLYEVGYEPNRFFFHRDFVTHISEKCPECGAEMLRRVGSCAVFHVTGDRCNYNDPFCPNKKNHGVQICECGKRRRKVTEEKLVEE